MLKKLGILGGMGPLATSCLFKKIIDLTDANCDQEHIPIFIYNNTSIPDRTAYLVNSGENPKEYLIESAKTLENIGADFLIMPCNTAHYFYDEIIKEINIPFLNMIEETVKYVLKKYPGIKKVGLLATDGTCAAGIYDKYFGNYGIEVIKPSKEKQSFVMKFIYDIKKGSSKINFDGFYEAVQEMNDKDVDVSLLGCTELSLAKDLYHIKGTYVDPLEVIAIRAIKYAGKNSLESTY
jgi:aspartate racemase